MGVERTIKAFEDARNVKEVRMFALMRQKQLLMRMLKKIDSSVNMALHCLKTVIL